jgi:hypothetical protein
MVSKRFPAPECEAGNSLHLREVESYRQRFTGRVIGGRAASLSPTSLVVDAKSKLMRRGREAQLNWHFVANSWLRATHVGNSRLLERLLERLSIRYAPAVTSFAIGA